MLRHALFGLAIVFSAVAAPSRVDACTCPGNRALPVWPLANATDVAVDVTLVVQVSGTPGVVNRLTDDTGTDVPLALVRTLEADNEGCTLYDYLFLRPLADLEPGRRYTVTTGFAEVNPDPAIVSSLAFMTGTAKREPPPAPAVDVSLFAQIIVGQRWLQLFASTTSKEPIFIRAIGENTAVVKTLGSHLSERIGIPLGNVACASVEMVDATGTTYRTANLCDPQKCLTVNTISSTSCGEHPGGESWARWQEVPDGCDPPPGPSKADGGATDVMPPDGGEVCGPLAGDGCAASGGDGGSIGSSDRPPKSGGGGGCTFSSAHANEGECLHTHPPPLLGFHVTHALPDQNQPRLIFLTWAFPIAATHSRRHPPPVHRPLRVTAVLVTARHRDNLPRLIRGEETRA